MTTATSVGPELPTLRRELGSWDSGRPGPTLLVLAGIHGNEPAGVLAVQRVLGRLQEEELPIAGRLLALAGNLKALGRRVRYLQRDLNRQWLPAAVDGLLAQSPAEDGEEDGEQRELLQRFESARATASGPVVFVDLHTSSALGPPFVCLADTIANRRVALATGVPLILGIEETIDGASLEWWSQRGVVNFAVEGGQHDAPATVGNLEAVLWLLLEHLGLLRRGQVDTAPFRAHLADRTAGLPAAVEIVARHAITPADAFLMADGFVNFQRIEKGELLATDRHGEIRAPRPGRVLLPLYQRQGDDGFFLAADVRPFWLRVAALLRRLRLGAIVHWLPGVRRDRGDRNTILVDPRVARWFVTGVFHLLGFRRMRPRGPLLAFTRRWSLPENRRLGPRP